MFKLRKHGLRFRLFKRKNINNGSGDNNNNSNDGEKTKEKVLGLPPNRGQIKLKTFGDMVRTGADTHEARGGVKFLSFSPQFHKSSSPTEASAAMVPTTEKSIDRMRRWRQAALVLNQSRRFRYMLDLRAKEKAAAAVGDGGDGGNGGDGGDDDGDAGGGSDDGDGDGDNDGGDNTEGGGGGDGDGGGKMDTKMESMDQPDFRDFRYNGGDENGYPVGQLHKRNSEKPNICSIIPYEKNILMVTAVMAAEAVVIVMAAAVWQWENRYQNEAQGSTHEKSNVCSIIQYESLV